MKADKGHTLVVIDNDVYTRMLPTYKLASFDIVNLYTNIPVNQTLDILYNNLIKSNKLDSHSINELICVCLLYTSRCV